MASKRNGSGKRDTDVTLADVVRELRSMSAKLDQHTRILEGHTTRLDRHTTLLDRHTTLLDRHTTLLEGHTTLLDRHTTLLEGHTIRLDRHTTLLGEIARDVREVKASALTRDRQLEARVSKLETNVAKLKQKGA